MEVIQSFLVDHTNLKAGIYVSRKDDKFTTLDLRFTCPNQEPAMQPAAIHTIEHLVATFLRNHSEWKDSVVYFGPMGCLTGFYLILSKSITPEVIKPLIVESMKFVENFEGIVPGTNPETCGNYLLHDLPMAKWEAKRYKERLITDFHSVYYMLNRSVLEGNLEFHDA